MKDTYYINKQYHTLVHVTYNTTQRTYEVMDTVDSKYYKMEYALRRAFDREYNK